MNAIPIPFLTVGLLIISNLFMTFAWYGHLKYPMAPLYLVVLISWGIALFEYSFQVPANRMGHQQFSAAQLKTMQEVITLIVFAFFSVFYLKEPLGWNHGVRLWLHRIGCVLYFSQMVVKSRMLPSLLATLPRPIPFPFSNHRRVVV